jgi:hypothetical protein
MKRVTAIAAAVFVAALVALSISVKAQDFNPLEKTYLTFSGPVELPGMTLPAGTYTFKLADTPSRNVVQVLSQDEKKIHGQFLFVQTQRRDPSGDTVVTFRETAEGTTPAVHYWFYPGETIGKEFVYPKDQAVKIAARTHSTVLSSEGDRVASIDETGKVTPFEGQSRESSTAAAATPSSPSAPAQPSAAAGSLAGNRGPTQDTTTARDTASSAEQTPAPSPAPAPARSTASTSQPSTAVGTSGQVAANELPRTASPLPITGLLGLFSLGGGLGLRAFRRW